MSTTLCEACGGPLKGDNRVGVCSRNPECRREWMRRRSRCWRAAHREKYNEKARHWNRAHPEWWRRYYAAHSEKIRERSRQWRAAHPEKARERDRRWRLTNAEKYRQNRREKKRRRRAREARAPVLPFAPAQLEARMRIVFDNRCLWCGGTYGQVDHFIPLAKGGRHDLINLVPACVRCNTSKRDLMPGDYLARLPV